MKKGITPIISIIILLLITIGLASAAWTYMSGYMNNLISRNLDVTPASCIGGTQVTFIVRNAGTNNIGSNSIQVMNMEGAVPESLTWYYPNGSILVSSGTETVLAAGASMRAKIANNCTSAGTQKTCKYELALAGSTWKHDLFVACTG